MNPENQNPTPPTQPVPTISSPTVNPQEIPSTPQPIAPVTQEVPEPKSNILPFLIILLVLIGLGAGGYWIYKNNYISLPKSQPTTEAVVPTPVVTPIPTVDPTANWKTYNGKYYSFKYDDTQYLIESFDETKLSQITNVPIPSSFINLMGYNPPSVINATKIAFKNLSENSLPADKEGVMQIWIFSNANSLNINQWYDKYDYYPIQYGRSIASVQEQKRPKENYSIDNINGNQKYLDLMGKTKLVYIIRDNKMYLFYGRGIKYDEKNNKEILPNQVSLILSTFKFTE